MKVLADISGSDSSPHGSHSSNDTHNSDGIER